MRGGERKKRNSETYPSVLRPFLDGILDAVGFGKRGMMQM